jgi:biotin-dependent carboxylase-like uncharacterized protein
VNDLLEIVSTGLGMGIQDAGRPGWRRFGVPPGGFLDDHAAAWANRLVGNPDHAPVLELLLQGGHLRALAPGWIAITGADAEATLPLWRPVQVHPGDEIRFPRQRSGVWTYLAIAGGVRAPRLLGSASTCARAGLGLRPAPGQRLAPDHPSTFQLPPGVAGCTVDPAERRDYDHPPALRLWAGPQLGLFPAEARALLTTATWTVSARSDRVGYRLEGPALPTPAEPLLSEPVLVGSLQVPPNGQPIVTLQDGPTVGGYPKIALLHRADISRLVQCRPGTPIHFRWLDPPTPDA